MNKGYSVRLAIHAGRDSDIPLDDPFERAGQIFAGTPLAMYIPQTTVNILLETLRANNLSGTPFATLKASTCMIDGPAVLKNQAITQLGKWSCLAITIMLGSFYRILFYFVLGNAQNHRH